MQEYTVVIGSGQKILVKGTLELSSNSAALLFKNGNEIVQIFAPGAWITVYRASSIERVGANVVLAKEPAFRQ